MKMRRDFVIKLLLLTIAVGVIGAALFFTVLKEYYLSVFPYLLVLFTLLTYSNHTILTKTLKDKPQKFTYVFMGVSAAKLFLMLIAIVVYLLIRRETVIPFLVGTFLLYLVFTFFEVKTLLRLVQGNE